MQPRTVHLQAMSRRLTDKVLLITGASSGIGAATALAAAREGMHVTLAARRGDRLKAIAKQVSDLGVRAHFFTCNVNNPQDVERLFEESWRAFGRLDAVFANAGFGLEKPVMDHTETDHRLLFETNYYGTVRAIRYGLPRLEATADGLKHLLICSSAASEIGIPLLGPYAATKAAQDALAGALRAEVKTQGVTVTTVHPIGTRTEFFELASQGQSSEKSTSGSSKSNTPSSFEQDPEHVADRVIAALKRPRPEVWPHTPTRFALAMGTAFPRLAAGLMNRHHRKQLDD